MNLHNHSGVLATVEVVLEFAVEALPYDHASVMLTIAAGALRSGRDPETVVDL
jgi:hypothetical protein